MAEYILVNIGCIECGVDSNIVGRFDDLGRAENLADELNGTHSWRGGGKNAFEVFEIPPLNVVDPEYLVPPE